MKKAWLAVPRMRYTSTVLYERMTFDLYELRWTVFYHSFKLVLSLDSLSPSEFPQLWSCRQCHLESFSKSFYRVRNPESQISDETLCLGHLVSKVFLFDGRACFPFYCKQIFPGVGFSSGKCHIFSYRIYHVYTHGSFFFSSPLLLDLLTEQGKALKNAARLTRHGEYDFRC